MAAAAEMLCCQPASNCSRENSTCPASMAAMATLAVEEICERVTCLGSKLHPLGMAWLPWWLWTTAFCLMLVVAIGGNSVVCWIILAHRHMRTVTNYFLVNLSVANLLMSCLNCSFNFIYMLNNDWPFGASYCVISNFMANLTVSASVLTLMAIALERYVVILHPMRRRRGKRGAVGGTVGIWASSALLSAPCLLYSQVLTHVYGTGELKRGCVVVWPGDAAMSSYLDYVYNMVFLATTYILPMLAMAVSYSMIGRELWGSKSIGFQTERQLASIRSKRKIVRMFIIVVVTFAVVWLPYQVYFVYVYHDSSLKRAPYVQHLFLVFYWLAMSYSMVNPLIYFWMNKRFRAYLRRLFRCCLPQSTLECFVAEPPRYRTNGVRARGANPDLPRRTPSPCSAATVNRAQSTLLSIGTSRVSLPASERGKLEPTWCSMLMTSGDVSPVAQHSSWPANGGGGGGGSRYLQTPPPFGAAVGRPAGPTPPPFDAAVGRPAGPTPPPASEGTAGPAAYWRRRDSDASEAFATPGSSPLSARRVTQVRLLMRLAPVTNPALTLALRCVGTPPRCVDTPPAAAAAEDEAARLLTAESTFSLDETIFDDKS